MKECDSRWVLPNYENGLVNMTSSILAHFGINNNKKTLIELDNVLIKNYSNIILFVCDGMGAYNIDRLVENKESVLIKNRMTNISSVYPPTTVASLASIESGLEPCEHARLGWTLYLEKLKKVITTFSYTEVESGKNLYNKDMKDELEFTSIFELLKNKRVNCKIFSPFSPKNHDRCYDLGDYRNKIIKSCKNKKEKFIYCYYNQPDCTMHEDGAFSDNAKQHILDIAEMLEDLKNRLKNSVIIVTCDHGQVNRKEQLINEEILNCCEVPPSIEPTVLAFKVKSGYDTKFVDAISKYMPDCKLFTAKEFMQLGLFGSCNMSPKLEARLCDYIAVATADNFYTTTPSGFIGTHAGLTKEEMTCPLIVIECK